MYDWPEVRAETRSLENALQEALCERLAIPPEDLEAWPEGLDLSEVWSRPDVLLTQTCGFPLTHALKGRVRLIGAPHYAAPGCEGVTYSSRIVVRKGGSFARLEDLRGARAAFNSLDSQSGMNAFRHKIASIAEGKPFFKKVTVTGSHLASARAVASGGADVACLDCVCWRLICNELPDLAASLDPIAGTASVPGLPLIASLRFSETEAGVIADTVAKVFSAPETEKSRERLGIRGFSRLSLEDYAGIPAMEEDARRLGYPELT